MRILLDTNIIIPREHDWVIPSSVQKLLRLIATRRDVPLVHPQTVSELATHEDNKRRQITLSKVASYELLRDPPVPSDNGEYYEVVPTPSSPNDMVDDALLYAVYIDAVDLLVSNDTGIQTKAGLLGLHNRVFGDEEAVAFLDRNRIDAESSHDRLPVSQEPLYAMRLTDPFFDSLREEYEGFDDWFREKSRDGQDAWVYRLQGGSLGAFMALKDESEPIALSGAVLPARRRVKIRTLKVSMNGYRVGELFLKIAIEFAAKNSIAQIYVTAFKNGKDHLYSLLHSIGFRVVGKRSNGEDVLIKDLFPENPVAVSSSDIRTQFYPSFRLSPSTKCFVVPIVPAFHERLFPSWKGTQLRLFFSETDGLRPEGNAITKAYLCNSNTRKIEADSVLFFYRSHDENVITSIGTVDHVYGPAQLSVDEILGRAGKRIVYTPTEIEEMVSTPALMVLFRWHFHFRNRVSFQWLRSEELLKSAPQSITEIGYEAGRTILSKGSIDDRFVVD